MKDSIEKAEGKTLKEMNLAHTDKHFTSRLDNLMELYEKEI